MFLLEIAAALEVERSRVIVNSLENSKKKTCVTLKLKNSDDVIEFRVRNDAFKSLLDPLSSYNANKY